MPAVNVIVDMGHPPASTHELQVDGAVFDSEQNHVAAISLQCRADVLESGVEHFEVDLGRVADVIVGLGRGWWWRP